MKKYLKIGIVCFLSVLSIRASDQPNIVIILSDDHSVNAISSYESKLVETPNIDRLASQGMKFNNVFCVNSICGPSRASILTGLYPQTHGQVDNYHHFPKNKATYPELMAQSGYSVALFGKTHMDESVNALKSMDQYMISHGAEYHNPQFKTKGQKGKKKHPGYVTDILTDKAIAWLKQGDDSKPRLLMVHHPAPHMPFQGKESLKSLFKDVVFPEPASFNDPEKNKPNSPRPDN